MKILVIIPARMGSSRFPGKPMAKILAKPMIGHVYENVIRNDLIHDTYVATCDEEIYNYILKIKGKAVMTSNRHQRASDRCAEALIKIEKINKIKYDIVVMVQGDEPMIKAEMISEALMPLLNEKNILVSNLLGRINSEEEHNDSNCIKVVCDKENNALYLSRSPIPSKFLNSNSVHGKQVCVIPFRRDFLLKYNKMEPTPLEVIESIDMLRILENGLNVKMVETNFSTYPVDTKEDLFKVEKLIKKNIS